MFLANYSDGLTDLPLPELVDRLPAPRTAVASFLSRAADRTPSTSVDVGDDGAVQRHRRTSATPTCGSTAATSCSAGRSSTTSQAGEELVDEPFQRLIERTLLVAYRYDGFWAPMDTFKDKQQLEALLRERPAGRGSVWQR